jgi:hypothetical protein
VFNALKGILGIPFGYQIAYLVFRLWLDVPVRIEAIFFIVLKFKRSYTILIDDGITAKLFDTGRL